MSSFLHTLSYRAFPLLMNVIYYEIMYMYIKYLYIVILQAWKQIPISNIPPVTGRFVG